jgi:hypothetical protein
MNDAHSRVRLRLLFFFVPFGPVALVHLVSFVFLRGAR